MTELTRRTFSKILGVGAASLAATPVLRAQGKPRVVVIGGGAGGATAARYIAKDSKGGLDVTLITASDTYTTCFFSNLYLGGVRTLDSITHNYKNLEAAGINVIYGWAEGVDRTAMQVKMSDGTSVPYDRLVVAPGVQMMYDSVPGYSKEAAEMAPHAWQAGPQTVLLKSQLDKLEDGQNIVIIPPPNPYRCPPGPYERVSLMAFMLKKKGFTNSSITVLDPKPKFSKQGLFQEAWENHYGGMVEWLGPDIHGGVTSVDAKAGVVETDIDTFEAGVLNVIPAMRAGEIAEAAGLTNDAGWCPVEADSMRSTIDSNCYVIGDASVAGAMPKSGFAANSQAKVAAMNVRGDLLESKVFPAKFSNTCWSMVATDDSIKVGAQYAPSEGKIASTSTFISQPGEGADVRKTTFDESFGWYDGIVGDMFG